MRSALGFIVIAVVAALLAMVIGGYCGAALGHAIARISNRDPAELKDMMIWCVIGTSLTFAAGAIWGSAQFLITNRWVKVVAGLLFCIVTLGSVGITTLAYMEAPRYDRR